MDNISTISAILLASINNEKMNKSCKKSVLLSPVSIEDFFLVSQENPDRVKQAFEEYIIDIQELKQELSEITDDKTYSQTRNVLSVFVNLLLSEKYESNENSPEMVWRAMGIFDAASSNNEYKFRGRVEELVFHETIALIYCGDEYSAFAHDYPDGVSDQTERAYFEAKGNIYSNILSTAKLFSESFGSAEYIARFIFESPDTLLSDPESLCKRITGESKVRNKSTSQKNESIKDDISASTENDHNEKISVKKDTGFSLCALSPFSSIKLTYSQNITNTIHFVMRSNIKCEKLIIIRQIKVYFGNKVELVNKNITLQKGQGKLSFDVDNISKKVCKGDTVKLIMKCKSGDDYSITFSFADGGQTKILNESFTDDYLKVKEKVVSHKKKSKNKVSSKAFSKKQMPARGVGLLPGGESLAYRAYINTQINNKAISEVKPSSANSPKNRISYRYTYRQPKPSHQPQQKLQSPFKALDPTPSKKNQKEYGDTILSLPLLFSCVDTFYVQSVKAVFRNSIIHGFPWLSVINTDYNQKVWAKVKIPICRRLLSGAKLYVDFLCKSNVLVEVEYLIGIHTESVVQTKTCPYKYSPPGSFNFSESLIESNHIAGFVDNTKTTINRNDNGVPKDPRRSQLTFRRPTVNSDTLICPICGYIVDNDCMKYNMFWKCERCGYSEGIE